MSGARPPVAVVTCGPGHAPLDAVRRITNFSTGELGALLCEALVREGWEVWCFRGEGATFRAPVVPRVVPFGTNTSLERSLRAMRGRARVRVVFHAAALCDFEAEAVFAGKARSVGEWTVRLRPAPKLLPRLRGLFPRALVVGWKYEVEGGRQEALGRAREQLRQGYVDACVANGPACGTDFFFVAPGARVRRLADKAALGAFLAAWAGRNALPGFSRAT